MSDRLAEIEASLPPVSRLYVCRAEYPYAPDKPPTTIEIGYPTSWEQCAAYCAKLNTHDTLAGFRPRPVVDEYDDVRWLVAEVRRLRGG